MSDIEEGLFSVRHVEVNPVKRVGVRDNDLLGTSTEIEVSIGEATWILNLFGNSDPYTLIKLLEDGGVANVSIKRRLGDEKDNTKLKSVK
tara:strand:+ start:2305 stop:2574 length:270 start_codon:yes stop_codon:yes gene_type:complete